MTYQPDPGTTLAAADAIAAGQDVFTRDQVAYLIHLAYLSGVQHRNLHDLGETVANWHVHTAPMRTREQAIAGRLAAYERHAGPPSFPGGLPTPPTFFPADPDRVPPRFPSAAEQAEWLTTKAAA